MKPLFRCTVLLAVSLVPTAGVAAPASTIVDKGDTAWMLTSTLLVLLMILPGLALFYGGLSRSKNMLSVMTQVGGAAAVAMLVWVTWDYSLAFGEGGPFIGGIDKLFLRGVTPASTTATYSSGFALPEYGFIAFQMTFAAVTAALILGSVVERIKFRAVLVFTTIWLTIVYAPVAHMVWAADGLFYRMGVLDFAGGTVVHINAGVSALVAALMVGKRVGYPREPMPPHSLTLTMAGAGLLWVGWFGFNAGSALEANGVAALAMVNTFVSPAAGALAWMLVERLAGHKGSSLGFCSGLVAGLVAVTPAAGNAGPFGAVVLGVIASLVCYLFVTRVKPRLGYDDSLDAFGIHGIGGMVGAIGTAVVCQPWLGGLGNGSVALSHQLLVQAGAVVATTLWASLGAAIALTATKRVTAIRPDRDEELEGLDLTDHGERAYNW